MNKWNITTIEMATIANINDCVKYYKSITLIVTFKEYKKE